MSQSTPNHTKDPDEQFIKRVHQELIDDYYEELEMEREDW